MLGLKYIKTLPNEYIIKYKNGKVKKEGAGISFLFYEPTNSIVAVSLASLEEPFVFSESTGDFQEVSIRGSVIYRVNDPKKLSGFLNYTLSDDLKSYVSDDPEKLPGKIVNEIRVLMWAELRKRDLKSALVSADEMSERVSKKLSSLPILTDMGVEILNFSVGSILADSETANVLGAEAREKLLKEADKAKYDRKNALVKHEKMIKENELETEIGLTGKKGRILEAKIEAERAALKNRQKFMEEEMQGRVQLEKMKKDLIAEEIKNRKVTSEARVHEMGEIMRLLKEIDPELLKTLAAMGMEPEKLIAEAFKNLAENTEKIGNLNISSNMLQELLHKKFS